MSTVGSKSYTWTLLKCAHVFSASTFLLTDLPNLFLWRIKQLLHAWRKNFLCCIFKKKKRLNSVSWVYGRHRGNVRPAPWPAECQLSSGAPGLGSQYSPKLGCPWCIRSWWLHSSRTLYLILLFLSRPKLFKSLFCMSKLHESSFKKKKKKLKNGTRVVYWEDLQKALCWAFFTFLWTSFPQLQTSGEGWW